MGLAPFLGFSVEEGKSENTLSHLIHYIDPEKSVNLIILEAEESVHLRKGAEIKAACVGPALLKACRDDAES